MVVRQGFYRWMLPAAFLLPLWLLVGSAIFRASGWAFISVLFIALPTVFFGQLAVTLLVRSRPTVRSWRALSWPDVVIIGLWHALIIALGFYPRGAFAFLFFAAALMGAAVIVCSIVQLSREGRAVWSINAARWNSAGGQHPETYDASSDDGASAGRGPRHDRVIRPDVIIIDENRRRQPSN
ncbi:MFS transporter permease [Microbacterium sp. YY-01]|uniref:MFS transporter permease n=1 Tax=Microbacterium sp. YY-01 TaxID=3421634 RepID=UPI003D16FCB0